MQKISTFCCIFAAKNKYQLNNKKRIREFSMKKAPSPLVSLIPIIVLVLLLFATIHTFGSDALSGGSQVSLLTTTAVCILIGMAFYKIPWKDYELAITNNVAGVTTAIIILLIIGALSGIWMISGVVPTLIYYGMQIIHPSFFLASTCIICVLISVMTGSSWTTIATIGIALMGIGKAQLVSVDCRSHYFRGILRR